MPSALCVPASSAVTRSTAASRLMPASAQVIIMSMKSGKPRRYFSFTAFSKRSSAMLGMTMQPSPMMKAPANAMKPGRAGGKTAESNVYAARNPTATNAMRVKIVERGAHKAGRSRRETAWPRARWARRVPSPLRGNRLPLAAALRSWSVRLCASSDRRFGDALAQQCSPSGGDASRIAGTINSAANRKSATAATKTATEISRPEF